MHHPEPPDLTIDPELRDLDGFETTAEEDAKFEDLLVRQVEKYGEILDAIKTWRGVIVDGHRRYRVARNRQLPYRVLELGHDYFSSKEEAIAWMREFQEDGRRNLSPHARSINRAELYRLRLEAKEKEGRRAGNTARELAEELGVSEREIHRDNAYSAAFGSLPKDVQAKALSLEATDKDVKALAILPPEQQRAVIGEVESGEFSSLGEALRGSTGAATEKTPQPATWKDRRAVAVKHCAALQREIDALNAMRQHSCYDEAVELAERLMALVQAWK